MRVSRLQAGDLNQLFLLKYPVRCRACLEREHVSFARAWRLGKLYRPGAMPDNERVKIDQRAVPAKRVR
jgi:hypothetical protein